VSASASSPLRQHKSAFTTPHPHKRGAEGGEVEEEMFAVVRHGRKRSWNCLPVA